MKKILLIVTGAIFICGATGVATYFFLVDKSQGEDEQASDQPEKSEQKSSAPPIYHTLHPKFIVNFLNPGRARYLEVSLEVMSREEKVIEAVKQHMPAIRDRLVLLFSSQESKIIATREGKEALRNKVLTEIQQVLQEQINQPGIEQVYFTSFVMQ